MGNTPIEPPYPLGGVNAALSLYEGEMTLRSSHDEPATGEGALVYSWLPTPRLRFSLAAAPRRWWNRESPTFELSLDSLAGAPAARAFVFHIENGSAGSSARGNLKGVEFGDASRPFNQMRFFIPNWPSMLGSPLDLPGGGGWRGRHSLIGRDWRITLDARRDLGAITDELRDVGGYAFTHVGELERRDGQPISLEEARDALRCLRYFLAFARGSWTPPILPVGIRDGEIVWREWAAVSTDPWRGNLTWFDAPHSLSPAFEAFADRWADESWKQSLELAVSWSIEANPSDPAETSIVLAQVALELLGWLVLVEEENVVTRGDWKKGGNRAERHIRALLQHIRLPITIPAEATELLAVADDEEWTDGPQALIGFRNKLVHPRNRAPEIFDTPVMARIQLAELASYYCEMALLYFCGYEGEYRERHTGVALPVPWT